MIDETEGGHSEFSQLTAMVYDLQHERDQYRDAVNQLIIDRSNLSMLVRRLCRELPKDNSMRGVAMDALLRWNLLTPLKTSEDRPRQCDCEVCE